ncbi:hypothetical protein Tco_1144433 [Tanacetum coccineum]
MVCIKRWSIVFLLRLVMMMIGYGICMAIGGLDEMFVILLLGYRVQWILPPIEYSSPLLSLIVRINKEFGKDDGDQVDIEKLDGKNDFGLWQVRMKAFLEQQGLAAALEELPAALIVAYDSVIQKKRFQRIDLVFGGDGGEGLYVRWRSGLRDMEQGTDSAWSKSHGRSSRLRNEDQVSGSGMELMGMILLIGNILLSDVRECRVRGTGKVQVQMRDGSSFMLDNVRYVPELRRNLISLGTLEKEGFTVKIQLDKIKVIKGSLVLLSGTRRAKCVYTLDGQAVTKKTLKGRKQLGEYQTRWKIKMGNVLDSCNQRNMGFNESGEYNKTFIGSGVGTSSVQVLQGVKFEVESQEDHTFEVEPHRNVDHVELFSYREDSNKAAFGVAAVDKIYAHESLTFNNIVACEVISMWGARLKDDINARSDVYVLSNDCRKCRDYSDGYYWEYTPGMFIHLFLYIDDMVFPCGCKAKIWATKGLLDKAKENTLLEGHSILSLEGSLLGDCDMENNGKWLCIYAVGSQEYQMVCTRLDIASADVAMMLHMMALSPTEAGYMTLTEAANEAIWLKGLPIESGFELKIVASIATRALSKAIPGPRFHHRLNLLSIGIG